MSESAIQVDLAVVDRLKPECDRLMADLVGALRIEVATDPVVIAAEVAAAISLSRYPVRSISEKVVELLPSWATPFERGLAMGMALVLAIHPPEA